MVRKQVKMGMFTLVVFFAFLIAIPSAALAQGPNKTVQENPCDQVDFTKKWQCESDRLQADRDRQRAGTPEEKLRLSCQHLKPDQNAICAVGGAADRINQAGYDNCCLTGMSHLSRWLGKEKASVRYASN